MGRPKMLLPWGRTTILGHSIQTWSGLVDDIIVIYSGADRSLQAELDRIEFPPASRIVNPDPSKGMFSSIQTAATWSGWPKGITHFVIVLGDQPHLRTDTLRAVLELAREFPERICQPSRARRPRHPVIIPSNLFLTLRDCKETTLKDVLKNHSSMIQLVEVNDPGLDVDIDRPEDYGHALRAFAPPA